MRRRWIASGLLLAATAMPALADMPQRTRSVIAYGDEACPPSRGDEIVVCAHEPESERYRIPHRFRDMPKQDAGSQSWSNRVATLDDAARSARPDSCSVVGSGGQTGCTAAMLRAWFADRRAAKAESDVP